MRKNILILVNGTYGDDRFCQVVSNYDYIICADNGMHHARRLKICPDLIVGDFDSASQEDLQYFKDKNVKIESFDSHKDATDTELAVARALALNPEKITIWGGVGTRLDHSLANVQLLYKMLQHGVRGELVDPYNRVMMTKDHIRLSGRKGTQVSLIPFGGSAEGVTTRQMEYPLLDAVLPIDNSLGISNVMLGEEAEIFVKKGMLLVILAKDQ